MQKTSQKIFSYAEQLLHTFPAPEKSPRHEYFSYPTHVWVHTRTLHTYMYFLCVCTSADACVRGVVKYYAVGLK